MDTASRPATLLHRYRLLWLTLEDAWESPMRKLVGGVAVLLMLAAVVGGGVKGAGVEIPAISSLARQGLLAGIGLLLLVAALVAPRTKAPAAAVLNDAAFWKEVFNVLPPAFIKEFPDPENVARNATLDAFQGDFRRGTEHDRRRALIRADHKRGDEDAAEGGESLQIELCDVSAVRTPKKILTYKKRVEYAGRIFVVGWCVPVEFASDVGAGQEMMAVKELGNQPVFEVVPLEPNLQSLTVRVGDSVRGATAAELSAPSHRRG